MLVCKEENGKEKSLRHVTVSVIAINSKAEILLIEKDGKYSAPGGFMDRDEHTSTGALKKLEDLTGHFGKISCLFQINDSPNRPKEDRQNVDFVYVVEVTGQIPNVNEKGFHTRWFPFDKLPDDEHFEFDHRKAMELYFQYRNNPFPLPIMGSI